MYQHQLYDEIERYHLVMSELHRIMCNEDFFMELDNEKYRSWKISDDLMRRQFALMSVEARFPELCKLVSAEWGVLERREWTERIEARKAMTKPS
jgi:hypothetical protein